MIHGRLAGIQLSGGQGNSWVIDPDHPARDIDYRPGREFQAQIFPEFIESIVFARIDQP